MVAELLEFGPTRRPDPRQGLFAMGMESVQSAALVVRLERLLELTLYATIVFDYPTIRELAQQLVERLPEVGASADGEAMIEAGTETEAATEAAQLVLAEPRWRPLALAAPPAAVEVLAADASLRAHEDLDAATAELELRFFVLFSSTAGLTGNVGQCGYAFANAYLDGFARGRRAAVAADRRRGRTLVLDWPLWAEGGMQVDADTLEFMARRAGFWPMPCVLGLDTRSAALASGPRATPTDPPPASPQAMVRVRRPPARSARAPGLLALRRRRGLGLPALVRARSGDRGLAGPAPGPRDPDRRAPAGRSRRGPRRPRAADPRSRRAPPRALRPEHGRPPGLELARRLQVRARPPIHLFVGGLSAPSVQPNPYLTDLRARLRREGLAELPGDHFFISDPRAFPSLAAALAAALLLPFNLSRRPA